MELVIVLITGILIGVALSQFIFQEKTIGSLRVDNSDPDSGPYLFLELNRDGAEAIYKKHSIRLHVDLKNYISQK